MARTALQTIAALAVPYRFGPLVRLATGDFLGEVHALETGPIDGQRPELCEIEPPFWMVSEGAIRWSVIADVSGQPSRVHPGNADQPITFEPAIERLDGAVVCRRGNRGAQHETAGSRRRGFDILAIRPDIADVRERECDDLAGVGGVCEDFLVAGDRGVETDFAYSCPGRSDTV